MRIVYILMQWKPHSCIWLSITRILARSAKHGSNRSSASQVTLPTEAWGSYRNQWGMIGIQPEPWGRFHY